MQFMILTIPQILITIISQIMVVITAIEIQDMEEIQLDMVNRGYRGNDRRGYYQQQPYYQPYAQQQPYSQQQQYYHQPPNQQLPNQP